MSRYPGYQSKVKNLVDVGRQRAAEELLGSDSSVACAVAQRRLESLRRLTAEITQITKLVDEAVEQSGIGLRAIVGVGPVAAGWILAEVGDIRRFPSMSQFAAANGTAPVPAASGRTQSDLWRTFTAGLVDGATDTPRHRLSCDRTIVPSLA